VTIINGWTLYAHPLFTDQLDRLTTAVERAKRKDPRTYQSTANAKLLAQLQRLAFETIPVDPARPEFRQGGTLGPSRKHWFRAKFGGGRFRLFFRYSSSAKIIVYAWVNDSETLRTYGAKSDAYAVFKAMLDKGNPPEDWAELLTSSSAITDS
jgi:toxin YhaV